jgi:predicted aldo/keto reductase-like oxidoreductase
MTNFSFVVRSFRIIFGIALVGWIPTNTPQTFVLREYTIAIRIVDSKAVEKYELAASHEILFHLIKYPGVIKMTNNANLIEELPKVVLGDTGLEVSRLSFGTGSNGWQGRSNQSDLGIDQLASLLQLAYEHGVNFWDSADAYGTHPHIARALQYIPRSEVVILTKTLSQKAKQVSGDIARYLKELETDYIDIVLLHVMTQADWPIRYGEAMAVLSAAQKEGKIRALGVSCHSLSALKACLDTDWCQVVMARINYAGVNMDAAPEKVGPILKKLNQSGKAVYGMKILGNGHLSSDVFTAIRYALNLGTIHAITIGIENQNQLMDNIHFVREFYEERLETNA